MNRSVKFVLGAVFASATFAQVALASPVFTGTGVHAIFGKAEGAKQVKVHVQNNAGQAIDIKVGDKTMSVAAGATVDIEAAEGTAVSLVTAVGAHQAGETLATLSKAQSGATYVVS